MKYTLHHGDCLYVMAAMPDNHFDSSITDPPYGLKFMGKDWDHGIPGIVYWEEVLRVLKPGAMLLAFGGTRTHHRLMVAIEDAGFELKDTISWVYGSGFPKSKAIGKAIDLEAGAEREVVGAQKGAQSKSTGRYGAWGSDDEIGQSVFDLTAPATEAAKLWDGHGTALKPSWEPIIVAMKPRDGTFANNALTHGVAGFNIDGARIPTDGEEITINTWDNGAQPFGDGAGKPFTGRTESRGRWPANLVHDGSDEVMRLFPYSKTSSGAVIKRASAKGGSNPSTVYGSESRAVGTPMITHGDQGSAARFFYCAKASKSERNAGLDGFDERPINWSSGTQNPGSFQSEGTKKSSKNYHPTVKPVDLMRWLAVLTSTPTGGSVLDPFMGSGSTGIGCQLAGRSEFVGIDITAEYVEIARARMRHWSGEKALEEWRSGKPTPAAANYSGLPLFDKE